jgi:hypothetical protein
MSSSAGVSYDVGRMVSPGTFISYSPMRAKEWAGERESRTWEQGEQSDRNLVQEYRCEVKFELGKQKPN